MIQNKPQLLLLLVSIICFSSCIERAYFHSPIQGNTSAYHAMPLASDSVKAATYLNSLLSIG
ncbi:MAG: hypothetical protein ABI813_07340, partial [Bacteroidota bacterium]